MVHCVQVGPKTDHFQKCVIAPIYDDIGRCQYIKMFSSLSGVRLACWMSPSLNILENDTAPQIPINLSVIFNYCTQFTENWQSLLTMNISRLTGIQRVYCVTETPSPFFLAHLLLRLTHRTQQCNRMCFRWRTSRKSWRNSFCYKALQSKELIRLRSNYSVASFLGDIFWPTLYLLMVKRWKSRL